MCYAVGAMAKLTNDERGRIAEKVMEIGNLVFVALVVGQILSNRIDLLAALSGIVVFVLAYSIAYYIMQ